MKRLTILNEGSNCTAWLAEGDQDGVECSSFTMPADADWQTVLQTLHSKMNLANHSPLGPWTEGGVIAMERLPWQSLQGGFGLPGWAGDSICQCMKRRSQGRVKAAVVSVIGWRRSKRRWF
jgi:hypothetical protein